MCNSNNADNTQTLCVRVFCQAYYDSQIKVPAGLTPEQAIQYASDHRDQIPLTTMHYVPDSDDVDMDFCYIVGKDEEPAHETM